MYNEQKCKAFQCDVTKNDMLENVAENSIDIVSLFFVMSAIIPSKMDEVIKNIKQVYCFHMIIFIISLF